MKHLSVKQFNEIKRTFQATKQNGFVTAVNARIVHEWLGVGRDFSNWIKGRIDKYEFSEHIDYCVVKVLSSPNLATAKSRAQVKTEYHCTPDMVKELAMIESSAMGKLARKYFIDCETKANQLLLEKEERQKLRVEFRPMTDAVMLAHAEPKSYHYSNEADMINRIVLGMTAAKFKTFHEIEKNENVRDYMTEQQINAVISLQRANTVFITMDEEFADRKAKLQMLFDKKHSELLLIELIEQQG